MIAAELWYPGGRTLEDDRRATSEYLSSFSLHNLLASHASFLLEIFLDKKEPGPAIVPARAEFAVEL